MTDKSAWKVVMSGEPPLGCLQAVILKTLLELNDVAHGYGVIEQISMVSGYWIDPSMVYTDLRKFRERGYINVTNTLDSGGGVSLKLYRVTPKGRAALKSAIEYYKAVAACL